MVGTHVGPARMTPSSTPFSMALPQRSSEGLFSSLLKNFIVFVHHFDRNGIPWASLFRGFSGRGPHWGAYCNPLGPRGKKMEPQASKKMLKALQNEVDV